MVQNVPPSESILDQCRNIWYARSEEPVCQSFLTVDKSIKNGSFSWCPSLEGVALVILSAAGREHPQQTLAVQLFIWGWPEHLFGRGRLALQCFNDLYLLSSGHIRLQMYTTQRPQNDSCGRQHVTREEFAVFIFFLGHFVPCNHHGPVFIHGTFR